MKKNKKRWRKEVVDGKIHFSRNSAGLKALRKQNVKDAKRQTYDECWNECNLDGSFAYNNVTDDF